MYLALMYPFYRALKLFPIITPRCPCCGSFQDGYHIVHDNWPRISFRCPTCDGEFVIWYNGKPSAQETWEQPVLVLKWPYAFGIYKRAKKPEPGLHRLRVPLTIRWHQQARSRIPDRAYYGRTIYGDSKAIDLADRSRSSYAEWFPSGELEYALDWNRGPALPRPVCERPSRLPEAFARPAGRRAIRVYGQT